jgi:hypothetical protein
VDAVETIPEANGEWGEGKNVRGKVWVLREQTQLKNIRNPEI